MRRAGGSQSDEEICSRSAGRRRGPEVGGHEGRRADVPELGNDKIYQGSGAVSGGMKE